MNYSRRGIEKSEKRVNAILEKLKNKLVVLVCFLVLVSIGMVGVSGLSAALGVWKGIVDTSPDITNLDVTPTSFSTTIMSQDGKTEVATLVAAGSNRKYVTIDRVPKHLCDAFVAIEDERFYEHNGIDLYSIARAGVKGLGRVLKGGSPNQGASTITQQLIKNNVFTGEDSSINWITQNSLSEKVERKIQEQYLALELEKVHPGEEGKMWILEAYMNSINLGANTLGVQAASLRYFGKDVSELTLSEAATIAGITQKPTAYNPITNPENNAKRREEVLIHMLENDFITQQEYDEAMADDPYTRIAEVNQIKTESVSYNSYYTDALINDVIKDLVASGYAADEADAESKLYRGGLRIISAQDPEIQKICDAEVKDLSNYDASTSYSFSLSFQILDGDGKYHNYTNNTMVSYYRKKNNNKEYSINFPSESACWDAIHKYEKAMAGEKGELVEGSEYVQIWLEPQVAMTVIEQDTGYVRAIVGGRGEKVGNRTWNRATDTTRQPGSTFKIVGCFAAALEEGGKTLASVQMDEPFSVGDWTCHNYNGRYVGYTTIRSAITSSMNVVTVKNLQDIGVDLGFRYAQELGITTLTEDDRTLSLALGGLKNGVTNLELTGAYAAIANGGTHKTPKFYTEVYGPDPDHLGQEILILKAEDYMGNEKVLSDETSFLLTSAMQDVMTKGTGTKAYFGSSMPQAGKSGTTTKNRDCLFAGYTPYYTCVVWGGYDDNSIQSATGYPKNLWRNVMSRIHKNLDYKTFDIPSGITSQAVCSKSGKIPIAGVCNRAGDVYSEYFNINNVPSVSCDRHSSVKICTVSGKLVGPFCPDTSVGSKYVVIGEGGIPSRQCDVHTAPVIEVPEEGEIPAEGTPEGTPAAPTP